MALSRKPSAPAVENLLALGLEAPDHESCGALPCEVTDGRNTAGGGQVEIDERDLRRLIFHRLGELVEVSGFGEDEVAFAGEQMTDA